MQAGEKGSLRSDILSYYRQFYNKNGEVPSITKIVRKLGTNKTAIYQLFPGGQRQMSSEAGIPDSIEIPKGPSRSAPSPSSNANIAVSGSSLESRANTSPLRLLLTEEQTARILGISHLENGKGPLEIMDELIDSDGRRRVEVGSSFAQERELNDFLASAKARGFSADALLDYLCKLRTLGLDRLSPTTLASMISLANELAGRGWNVAEFVEQATRSNNIIFHYTQYRRGNISGSAALRSIQALKDRAFQ